MSVELKILDDVITSQAYIIEKYLEKYGNISLESLIRKLQGKRVHECPQCNGKGEMVRHVYNRSEYTSKNIYFKCDLCEGYGYTEQEKKPRMVQIGWD